MLPCSEYISKRCIRLMFYCPPKPCLMFLIVVITPHLVHFYLCFITFFVSPVLYNKKYQSQFLPNVFQDMPCSLVPENFCFFYYVCDCIFVNPQNSSGISCSGTVCYHRYDFFFYSGFTCFVLILKLKYLMTVFITTLIFLFS